MISRPNDTARIVAHRGLHSEPEGPRENTLAAIGAALAEGVAMIEIDVRVTRDGAVVLLHDPTLDRLWGDPRGVAELDLTEVRELGGGERRIPLLSEALELVRGSGSILLIDMDEPGPAGPAAEVVREEKAAEFTAWCGNPEAMRIVRAALPDAEIWQPWYSPEPPTAADLAGLRPAVVNAEHLLVGRGWVEAMHALGTSVSCWTVDDPAQAVHLAAIGVDSITTNRVAEVRAGLAAGEPDERGRQRAITAELAGLAAEVTRRARRDGIGLVETKTGPADHVTEIDLAIERGVRQVINTQFPDHDLVGEEYGGTASEGRPCWYVDPIDGTANLANGVPWTSFSLALVEDGRPVTGAVLDPIGLTPVVAAEGRGAWRDGTRLRTRPRPPEAPLTGAVVTTELAAARPWDGLTGLLDRLGELHCTLRIPGSGTATLAGLALGRGAAAIIHSYSPTDHAAALLIILEAGGTVLDPAGVPRIPTPGEPVIAGCDPITARALWSLWRDG